MSVYNCHKQQPQPWMSYISPNKITYKGDCCPVLVTLTTELPPFQVISEGDFVRCEISVYGSGVWTEITLPITTVITDGFYIHSYNGEPLEAALDCGPYEFRLIAGETWWFEPIMIEDFEHTENSFTARDLLMTPLKFSEQRFDTLPLIAPCDSFLPFMFTTENATNGSPTYTLVAADGTETALTITVDVLTISGRTYYIHDGACFYPFLTCGQYYIRINDGAFTYYSVPFNVESGMNDIADGYRPMRDANGCVIRSENGLILFESCMGGLNIESIVVGLDAVNVVSIFLNGEIDPFSEPEKEDFLVYFNGLVTVSSVMAYTERLDLFLSRSITIGEIGYLHYISGTHPLQTIDGKPIGSFYHDITNLII